MESKVMRLEDIKPAEYNPRVRLTEVDHEYKALKASIDEFGLVVPLIVNERTGTLVSGHQRLNVMLAEGVEETEVVIVDMEPEREKALCIALNKISGQWDYGALADILEELRDSPVDILATGFSDDEIADLLGELQEEIGGGEAPDVERGYKRGRALYRGRVHVPDSQRPVQGHDGRRPGKGRLFKGESRGRAEKEAVWEWKSGKYRLRISGKVSSIPVCGWKKDRRSMSR